MKHFDGQRHEHGNDNDMKGNYGAAVNFCGNSRRTYVEANFGSFKKLSFSLCRIVIAKSNFAISSTTLPTLNILIQISWS